MKKQALPAVSTVTKESIEEFKTADKVVVVGFWAAGDNKANETFNKYANANRDTYLFGASNDADLAKAEGAKTPGFVLYKTFDEGKNVFDGKFDEDEIAKFVKTAATPLIGEVGPETYSGYMEVSLIHPFVTSPTLIQC